MDISVSLTGGVIYFGDGQHTNKDSINLSFLTPLFYHSKAQVCRHHNKHATSQSIWEGVEGLVVSKWACSHSHHEKSLSDR